MVMLLTPPHIRSCLCDVCESLAEQSISMAHQQIGSIFATVEHAKITHPQQWDCVGQCLVRMCFSCNVFQVCPLEPCLLTQVRVLHTHICLLAETQTRQSVVRSAVWQAQKCLYEWAALCAAGLAVNLSQADLAHVHALDRWTKRCVGCPLCAESTRSTPSPNNHTERTAICIWPRPWWATASCPPKPSTTLFQKLWCMIWMAVHSW